MVLDVLLKQLVLVVEVNDSALEIENLLPLIVDELLLIFQVELRLVKVHFHLSLRCFEHCDLNS